MLVLARRADESIVFPNVGIKLKVIRIKGQVARLGIEAPEDVSILRGEIAPVDVDPRQPSGAARMDDSQQPSAEWIHALRNRLNYALLSAEVLQQQVDSGHPEEFSEKFSSLLDELQSLDEMLEPAAPPSENDEPDSDVRVLVVDDQENERTLLASLLEMRGCRVDTVGDGVEAMEYLDTHPQPDFVLLDMSMPRCSGPEFLENLRRRQEFQDLRVFAVSGHSSHSAGVPVGPDGVDGWFRKPLNTSRLISSMNKVAHA
jgi:carbon storage regulator CsrA